MSANETTLHRSHNVSKVNTFRSKYGLQLGGWAYLRGLTYEILRPKTIINSLNLRAYNYWSC